MGDKGGELITLYEARIMMDAMLKNYEREVVEPRHKETQDSIGELKGLVQQGKGMRNLGAFLLTLGSIAWIAIQITQAVKH